MHTDTSRAIAFPLDRLKLSWELHSMDVHNTNGMYWEQLYASLLDNLQFIYLGSEFANYIWFIKEQRPGFKWTFNKLPVPFRWVAFLTAHLQSIKMGAVWDDLIWDLFSKWLIEFLHLLSVISSIMAHRDFIFLQLISRHLLVLWLGLTISSSSPWGVLINFLFITCYLLLSIYHQVGIT